MYLDDIYEKTISSNFLLNSISMESTSSNISNYLFGGSKISFDNLRLAFTIPTHYCTRRESCFVHAGRQQLCHFVAVSQDSSCSIVMFFSRLLSCHSFFELFITSLETSLTSTFVRGGLFRSGWITLSFHFLACLVAMLTLSIHLFTLKSVWSFQSAGLQATGRFFIVLEHSSF